MHKVVREDKRARRRANWGYTDSEDTDSEEGEGEMDNFQNLQLGSLSPVVRLKCNLTYHFPRLTAFVYRIWIEFSSFDARLNSLGTRISATIARSHTTHATCPTLPSMHMTFYTHRHSLSYHHDNPVSKEYIPQTHGI